MLKLAQCQLLLSSTCSPSRPQVTYIFLIFPALRCSPAGKAEEPPTTAYPGLSGCCRTRKINLCSV